MLDKENAAARKGIFMMDASKGFMKDGPKNRLREQDIHKIVDTFSSQTELPRFSRMVPVTEIADPKNAFNLNLPRYIDSTEPEDIQDIEAHLRGGIPDRDIDALDAYWKIMPGLRAALFEPIRPDYSALRGAPADLKVTIFAHKEFTAFHAAVTKRFDTWRQANAPALRDFRRDGKPKALIATVSESLLADFKSAPLLDAYDIYQHLMDFWAETMQDDCYLIAADDWTDAARPTPITDDKSNKASKEKADLTVGRKKFRTELIPPALLIARYFSTEQDRIGTLEADIASIQQQMEEMTEEHGADGGLLEEARNEKDKITRASAAARLKDIKSDKDASEERQILTEFLRLCDQEAAASTKLKSVEESLTESVFGQYAKLTEDDIKSLVVDDKWLASLASAIQGELDRVSQTLTGRIRQLADRYASPLPQLTTEVAALAAKVDQHLKKMGHQASC